MTKAIVETKERLSSLYEDSLSCIMLQAVKSSFAYWQKNFYLLTNRLLLAYKSHHSYFTTIFFLFQIYTPGRSPAVDVAFLRTVTPLRVVMSSTLLSSTCTPLTPETYDS